MSKSDKSGNLALWNSVCRTDPAHTKSFTRSGGFKGTAIKPIYLIHKATELWGPMGVSWGADSGDPIISGDTVFIKACLWYSAESGAIGRVEHWGGDVIRKGPDGKPNDEAVKMAFTDAIGKCLVQLGFSADVHMGLFDDSKYLAEVKAEYSEKKRQPSVDGEFFAESLRALGLTEDAVTRQFGKTLISELNEEEKRKLSAQLQAKRASK